VIFLSWPRAFAGSRADACRASFQPGVGYRRAKHVQESPSGARRKKFARYGCWGQVELEAKVIPHRTEFPGDFSTCGTHSSFDISQTLMLMAVFSILLNWHPLRVYSLLSARSRTSSAHQLNPTLRKKQVSVVTRRPPPSRLFPSHLLLMLSATNESGCCSFLGLVLRGQSALSTTSTTVHPQIRAPT
jgi:hypothetical protein